MAQKNFQRWEQMQIKTFTNWANMHLAKRSRKINSITEDLKDGVNLLYLLSALSDEPVAKHVSNPRSKFQCVENLNTALKFIERHNVKLANIGATEIHDGNVKMTLGMIWCLILRFVVSGLSEEGLSAKEGLLLWCQRKTEGYRGVNVIDFSSSFQDGLAFCALIHRHRPNLIDYDALDQSDKVGNLNLAFQTAADHLEVPRLLDVEDLAYSKPDEQSVMTYVAQLYKVFSTLDRMEQATQKISSFLSLFKGIQDFAHDYERRVNLLLQAVNGKISEMNSTVISTEYLQAKHQISEFRQYRKTLRRQWVEEQSDLSSLFTQIQAKLNAINRPPYVPPPGYTLGDVEGQFEILSKAERNYRHSLNSNLRDILNQIRQEFATLANSFYESLQEIRISFSNFTGNLKDRIDYARNSLVTLDELSCRLSEIEATENACIEANIEENEFTDHTFDDLLFEHEQTRNRFIKIIETLESQIAAQHQEGVSAEQMEEYRMNFNRFDQDKDGNLSRLEFKSLLSGIGLMPLDFEGHNKRSDEIFNKVSAGQNHVNFDQFVNYITAVTADNTSIDALCDAFNKIADGKDYLTMDDLRSSAFTPEQVEYMSNTMNRGGADGQQLDYNAWLQSQIG